MMVVADGPGLCVCWFADARVRVFTNVPFGPGRAYSEACVGRLLLEVRR